MKSIWQKNGELPQFPALQQDIHTDILIIGGGIAGLLCAYRLEKQGADYCLIESDRICRGVSGSTTAKLTAQHGLVYHKLLSRFGPETALAYYEANAAALEEYQTLAKQIDCDYQKERSFAWNSDKPEEAMRERRALEQMEIPHSFVENVPLPVECAGAVCFEKQGRFHPLKFLAEISKNLRIYEHSPALKICGDSVWTGTHSIHANKIVVATHFPILNRHGSYFLKQYQHRSYVLALEEAGKIEGMYLDAAKNGFSFRMQGTYLLLGGGGHRTGKKGGGWNALESYAQVHFPNARVAARWATQDCMSLDDIAYIGRYSRGTENLFVATGFNKWGMTTAMAGAMLLEDLLQGKHSPWESLYDPSRSILHKQLLINGFETTTNLLCPTAPRCTHLGCALHWNHQERSWDCSCHGSRFSEEGQMLENPAQKNMNI